jgi:tetratricopeptide (TPR) repeat protein
LYIIDTMMRLPARFTRNAILLFYILAISLVMTACATSPPVRPANRDTGRVELSASGLSVRDFQTIPQKQSSWDSSSIADNSIVAVLPFDNTTRNEQYAWLSTGIMSVLTNHVASLSGWTVLDRGNLERCVEELEFAMSDVADQGSNQIRVGRFLVARIIIVGDYQIIDNQIMVNARAVEVETTKILGSHSAVGSVGSDVFGLQDQIARGLADQLGVPVAPETLKLAPPASADGIRFLEMAREFMLKGNYAQAEEYALRSLDADPAYFEARAFYIHTLHIQQRYDEAYAEAAEAAEALQFLDPAADQQLVQAARLEALQGGIALSQVRLLRFGKKSESLLQERRDTALRHFIEAQELYGRALAEESFEMAVLNGRLGWYYSEAGEHQRAIEYFSKQLRTYAALVGYEESYSVDPLMGIGEAYHLLKMYDQSLEFLHEALRVAEKTHPPTSRNYAYCHFFIGLVRKEQGLYGDAIDSMKAAVSILERTLGEDEYSTKNMYRQLADAYFKAGNKAMGDRYLKKSR